MSVEVSIITASYNKEKYISETITSVLNQTCPKFELIIIDDASTDHTVSVVKEFKKRDERVKLIVNKSNHGANFCRNQGIKEAQGRYIIFLDADDLLTQDCIECRLDAAGKSPGTDLLVFTMGVFYKKVGDDDRRWRPNSKNALNDFLQHKLPWSILQPIWKRGLLLELGGFDEQFKRLQDVELHTRALLLPNLKYQLIEASPDCYYRIDEERKNFDSFHFLDRWVDAALQYCEKFSKLLLPDKRRFLFGTLYQTYLQVLLKYRAAELNKAQMVILEQRLLNSALLNDGNGFRRVVFRIAKIYNLHFKRIPGVNRLLSFLLS